MIGQMTCQCCPVIWGGNISKQQSHILTSKDFVLPLTNALATVWANSRGWLAKHSDCWVPKPWVHFRHRPVSSMLIHRFRLFPNPKKLQVKHHWALRWQGKVIWSDEGKYISFSRKEVSVYLSDSGSIILSVYWEDHYIGIKPRQSCSVNRE